MKYRLSRFPCLAALSLIAAMALGLTRAESHAAASLLPEAASGRSAKTGWATQRFSVAAANPLAAAAGYQMLKDGGSAVDAPAGHAVLAAGIFHTGEMTVRDLKEQLAREGVEVRPC